jgi:hypothetical protein
LGHVLAERTYVEDYQKQLEIYEEKGDPSDPKYGNYDEKTESVHMTIEHDPLVENSHLAGKLMETKVLSEFFEVNGKPVKLTIPTDPSSPEENPKKWHYKGIIITVKANKENVSQVTSADIDFPDKSIQPKKSN